MIDLMESRMTVAESSMANLVAAGLYSDGTGFGGKQLTGLNAAVPVVNTNTYGGIDANAFPIWRNYVDDNTAAELTPALIQGFMNLAWSNLVRGVDRPDIILMDALVWQTYIASLQSQQRFTDPNSATLGFPTIKYMDADCVLDGGIGGFCPGGTMFLLNTKFIFFRPHSARNMVPLAPNKRYAVNQDAEVQILAFAGNMTSSGRQFQGRIDFNG